MWVWLLSTAMAGCPEQADAVIRASTGAVEVAFVQVDDDAFLAAADALRAAVPCAVEAIDPETALWMHRAWALMRFVDGDRSATQRSFSAIRRLDPSWQPPDVLIPPGHPLASLWQASSAAGGAVAIELAPAGGWLVDGYPDTTVPTGSAFVLQGLDRDGAVVLTGYYASASEIPLTSIQALSARPKVSPRRRRARTIGTIASGSALLVGGGFLVAAAVTADQLATADRGEVLTLEKRLGTYQALSGIFLGAGAVGGGATWVIPW